MQFIELREQLKHFLVISLTDIRKLEADFDLRRLNEWQEKNYIKRIRKGFYMFSDQQITDQTLYTIANRIYEPSYISLQMALSIHGLIPEAVFGITSVTSRNTKTLQTPIGDFIYRHIKPELMFGYELREYEGHRYQIAEMEKALLDYLYLNAKIDDNESFEGVRFNAEDIKEKMHIEKFTAYAEAFHSKSLNHRVKKFLAYIHNHA